MDEKLLSLPWEIQLALGCGYAAYAIAYVGIRAHHKPVETAFRTITFGLIATLVLSLTTGYAPWIRVGAAGLASITGGLLWRFFGIDGFREVMRKLNMSWSDETPSAWFRVTQQNARFPLTQISVLLDDGTWLNCDQCGRFNDSPFGPAILGPKGDVALYVTERVPPGAAGVAQSSIIDAEYGDRITYVPAASIKRVTLRHLKGA